MLFFVPGIFWTCGCADIEFKSATRFVKAGQFVQVEIGIILRASRNFSIPPPPCRQNLDGGDLFQRRQLQPPDRAEFFSSAALRRSPIPGNSSSTLSEIFLRRNCAL